MKSNDIGGWISGLLVLIGLAYSLGQGNALREFAQRQAARALFVRPSEHFFTSGSAFNKKFHGTEHTLSAHSAYERSD
jgi:hypothetical protein